MKDELGNIIPVKKCPFCRTPLADFEEIIKRTKKRMDAGDADSIFHMGCFYGHGINGLLQDKDKALQLWHRAAEFGHADAYHGIALAYTFMADPIVLVPTPMVLESKKMKRKPIITMS